MTCFTMWPFGRRIKTCINRIRFYCYLHLYELRCSIESAYLHVQVFIYNTIGCMLNLTCDIHEIVTHQSLFFSVRQIWKEMKTRTSLHKNNPFVFYNGFKNILILKSIVYLVRPESTIFLLRLRNGQAYR